MDPRSSSKFHQGRSPRVSREPSWLAAFGVDASTCVQSVLSGSCSWGATAEVGLIPERTAFLAVSAKSEPRTSLPGELSAGVEQTRADAAGLIGIAHEFAHGED
jgi:hypothetical protein